MKSVLVTGGTTRLGLVIADGLRTRGWRVLTSSHRADAGADFVADLSNPQAAERLYAAVCAVLGGAHPDALVNNAALFSGDAERLEQVNLESPKKLITLMAGREAGRGAVVNILDTRILQADGEPTTYCRTKRALLDFTRTAAARCLKSLRVNGVAPGPVMRSAAVHEPAGETPLGRPTPQDVAAAVAFLLEAESTTGCIIPVDGGQFLTLSPSNLQPFNPLTL